MAHPHVKEKPEHILCSAIWYDDEVKRAHLPKNVTTGIVASALRHCNCFTLLAAIYPDLDYMDSSKYKHRPMQGFLTSKGRFVDRKEGGEIAFAAGQTETLIEKLHSEDLW